ncbi:MAG: beta-lactamase family protein [Chlorobi bacterium]|nr:beta-lactamase family protein [Chlorobiota bacterium]
MKIINYFIFSVLIISIIACKPQQRAKENKKINALSHLVTNSYKPPYFENDKRAEKIKEIAPQIQRLFEEHAKAKHIPGIAYGIVVDNELVVASATGIINLEKKITATTKSSFRIASMTKSFTAMAILKLRDEGKLSLHDPVEKYIPEMSELKYLTSDSPVIDIENLLTMTAGFPEDNPWGDRQLDETDTMLINLVAKGISFSNPPSYSYEYSNTGFALLGHIITVVSGKPFQEYISENILLPLKMEHTYWEFDSVPENLLAHGYRWENEQWKTEPMLHDGVFGCMGGLITTIEDFSKYVSFHLSAWPPRSEPDNGPVKRSTLREMHTAHFANLNANATDWNNKPCATIYGYGYGLRIAKYCNGIKLVSHGGALPGFGSSYTFFPEYGVGVMAFGNLTYTTPWPLKKITKLLFETIDLQARKLPASDILVERQKQIVQIIQAWDKGIEDRILAENFYMDKSREQRMFQIKEILSKAGAIQNVEKMEPINQLRGSFKIKTQNGLINVFFTLTPENNPKVQRLDVSYQPNETKLK